MRSAREKREPEVGAPRATAPADSGLLRPPAVLVAAGGLAALLALAAALLPAPAAAEPYLAIRTGMKCAMCHVNGTGGGKRTDFGNAWSQTLAPWVIRKSPGGRKVFDPRMNEFLSVGGDLRVVSSTTLRPGRDSNGFEFTEANLYFQADMVPGFLSFYLDQKVAPGGALSREAFLLVTNAENTLRFKAGRMILPFGFALWDDAAFIRSVTGFDFDNSDLGAEVGYDRGELECRLAVTNGTQGAAENNRSKQVSSIVSWVTSHGRAGASYSYNRGTGSTRIAWGAFAGHRIGPVELLAEHDVVRDRDDDGELERFGDAQAAYVEGNLAFLPGTSLKVAWEWWDPFAEIEEDSRATVRVGVESFLTQFLQARAFYRWRDAPPQLVGEDVDLLDLEIHAYF